MFICTHLRISFYCENAKEKDKEDKDKEDKDNSGTEPYSKKV